MDEYVYVSGNVDPLYPSYSDIKDMYMYMHVVYYFIVYVELLYTISRYRAYNDYTRWCLTGALIYKITC